MPAKQTFFRKSLLKVLSSIKHHFNDTFYRPVSGYAASNINPKTPGYRRSHLVLVQHFTLDLTAFDHFLGKGLKHCFFPKRKSQGFHMAN